MKNTKRITAIILSALMTVSAFSTLSVSAATVDSNAPVALADFQSQNDIKWNIDLNGTLHISGSGIINEDESSYDEEGIPWYEDRNRIKKVIVGEGITGVGNYAFWDCCNLESIEIPESVTYIGVFCFLLDTKLYSINVDSNNKYYSSVDGILLNKDKTEIVKYPNKMQSTYDIPNTVTDILPYAFRDDTNLQYISLPQNITTVGYGAFMDCPNLVKVTLPTELTTIDSDAFGYLFRMGGNIHVNDFKIYGYKNTAAEEYALNNEFEFINLAEERTLTDKATSISVSGVVNSNADLNVSKLENTYEKSVATYDITLQKDGIAIQPDGAITIKIPSDVKDCKVMWLKDDGTAEDMNAEYIDGCYVFTTNHLSVYALVQNKQYLKGDANQDGIVNVNDVTYLQRHLAGRLNTDGSALIDETNKSLFDCLDLNKDVKLTVEDITELQVYIIKNN